MKILYDHQAFQMQYFGGVSKCFCELISHLPDGVQAQISIAQSNNVHLRESGLVEGLGYVTMDHRMWNEKHPGRLMDILYLAASKYLDLPTADSQNRRMTNRMLKQGDYDVFHPTYFKPEFLKYLGKKPFVLTIHDMMPELYPQYYGSNYPDIAWKKQLVKRADAIVAVSECTKNDVINILGVPEEKITVIHHGGPASESHAMVPRIVNERYLLYVGQRMFYKNFTRLLESFSAVASREDMSDVLLVCTGAPFSDGEKALIARHGISDRIVFMHPTDAEMQILYRDALAFVYPSGYEGFGMPILEAFANGCPVLLNDASSFPEVGGDAARYFRFDNGVGELSQLLVEVATEGEESRKEWVKRGLQRLGMFSWEKSAQRLVNVYKSVL